MTATDTALETLQAQISKAITNSQSLAELEQLRINYLGKKGRVTTQLKRISSLPVEQRKQFGQSVNQLKQATQRQLAERQQQLSQQTLEQQQQQQTLDISLPGRRQFQGALHPVSQTIERISALFANLGFDIASGPEIEDDYYNFEALNIPQNHPARAMHDTFYIRDHVVLRTHTSTVQIRFMENNQPPIRVIAPGRVYRCDSDATHTPMFHQLEGLVVDSDTTFADLKGILTYFIQAFFEAELPVRFRPSYFPFTEPSAEVDMGCVFCHNKGCRICKQTGWLEVLGCGMVHPKVLENGDINPQQFSGYAFGLGVERLTMLRHGVTDLRLFFNNELSFLKQFS